MPPRALPIDLTINRSKDWFFDRPKVMAAVDKGRHRALNKVGALVRTTSMRSIRRPRRTKLSELTEEQQEFVKLIRKIAKKEGRPAPKLPFAPSKPGEPPRTPTGLLRKTIYYVYDPQSESVVVGPAKLNKATQAPSVLEFGGRNDDGHKVLPRPFMRPALETVARVYPDFWKDAIR